MNVPTVPVFIVHHVMQVRSKPNWTYTSRIVLCLN